MPLTSHHQSSSTSPGSSPENEDGSLKCGLFDLPQELVDMIFDFAYQKHAGGRLISLHAWHERERDRRRAQHGYTMKPFPAPKVEEFMINKKFFTLAARTWVQQQETFMLKSDALAPHQLPLKKGIIRAYVSSWRGPSWIHEYLHSYPQLRDVGLEVSFKVFEAIEPIFAWEVDLSEDHLKKVARISGLSAVSGLTWLRLTAKDCKWAETPKKKQIWEQNVKKLEQYLQPIVTEPRAAEDMTMHTVSGYQRLGPEALYYGSSVKTNRTHYGHPQSAGNGTSRPSKSSKAAKAAPPLNKDPVADKEVNTGVSRSRQSKTTTKVSPKESPREGVATPLLPVKPATDGGAKSSELPTIRSQSQPTTKLTTGLASLPKNAAPALSLTATSVADKSDRLTAPYQEQTEPATGAALKPADQTTAQPVLPLNHMLSTEDVLQWMGSFTLRCKPKSRGHGRRGFGGDRAPPTRSYSIPKTGSEPVKGSLVLAAAAALQGLKLADETSTNKSTTQQPFPNQTDAPEMPPKPLASMEVPETVEELRVLVDSHGAELIHWIQAKAVGNLASVGRSTADQSESWDTKAASRRKMLSGRQKGAGRGPRGN
jgi:hypothetical protein